MSRPPFRLALLDALRERPGFGSGSPALDLQAFFWPRVQHGLLSQANHLRVFALYSRH